MASTNPSPATTAQSAVEASAAPTEQPSAAPSAEPSVQPGASSAAPTTPPVSSAEPSVAPSSTPPQSSAPPQSSQAPPSSSAQPTSQPPSSASSPPSSSQQSSQEPSSQVESSALQSSAAASSTSSPGPTSAASSSPSASASVSRLTSAIDVTTTDSQGHVVTTKPSLITQTATSTDEAGKVWTVTQIVANPTGLNDSSSSKSSSSSFFDNTGAVAGTFVVVGLGVTAGILAFVFFMLKRRRRQRLDRDVAAAAAAAAAAAHHSRRDMDDFDDEKTNPAMTQYGGYYAGTDIHGEPEQHMGQYDYEDPTGGYDHYAANLAGPGDRMSTATAPGVAGFGAQAAQATYGQQAGMYAHPEAYEDLDEEHHQHSYPPHPQTGYNALSRDSVPSGGHAAGGYYFDPKDAGQFDYADEDVYAYNEQATQDHPVRPAHQRTGSEGSVARVGDAERGLKVTNA